MLFLLFLVSPTRLVVPPLSLLFVTWPSFLLSLTGYTCCVFCLLVSSSLDTSNQFVCRCKYSNVRTSLSFFSYLHFFMSLYHRLLNTLNRSVFGFWVLRLVSGCLIWVSLGTVLCSINSEIFDLVLFLELSSVSYYCNMDISLLFSRTKLFLISVK